MFIEGNVSISLVLSDSISLHDHVILLHTLSRHDFTVGLLMFRDDSPGAHSSRAVRQLILLSPDRNASPLYNG